MRIYNPIVVLVILSLSLGACNRNEVKENIDVDNANLGDGSGSGASTSGLDVNGGLSGNGLNSGGDGDPLSKRVVYFDYDSSALTAESQVIVEAHANYMISNPGVTLVLEGHADERGTREYNLALGEDRAKSVAKLMQAMGASSSGIRAVSYGEERPVALAQDESAWGLNRRVEILYSN